MKSHEFCYWLQGYFEIEECNDIPQKKGMTAEQTEMVKKHLALVFKHEIDPSYGDEDHQKELDEIHNPEFVNLTEMAFSCGLPHEGPKQNTPPWDWSDPNKKFRC